MRTNHYMVEGEGCELTIIWLRVRGGEELFCCIAQESPGEG